MHTIKKDSDTGLWHIESGRYACMAACGFESRALALKFIQLCAEHDENPEGRPRVRIGRKAIADALGAEWYTVAA
jgi:hypothetical protein